MIAAILSSRIRTWVLFTVLMPLVGRLLQTVGVRVGQRNPRAGQALTKVGGYAQRPSRRAASRMRGRRPQQQGDWQ